VQAVRTIVVKNGRSAGQKMAVMTFEDRTGSVEAVCFTDPYLKYGHLIQPDAKLFVIGEVDLARGTPQIKVERVLPIEAAPRDPVSSLDLLVDGVRYNGESTLRLERAAQALVRHITAPPTDAASAAWQRPPVQIRVFVRLPGAPTLPVKTAEGWSVKPSPALLRELARHLGEGSVRLSGPLLAKERDEQRERWGGKSKVKTEA
jgi:DNA polymerase III alpha subunit